MNGRQKRINRCYINTIFIAVLTFAPLFLQRCSTLYCQNAQFKGLSDWTSKLNDKEKLSLAVGYFQSGKYHEALLMFKKLDSKYRLNPRFQAYMGVSYFYDGEYEKAIAMLENILKKLQVFSPHEQSVYYYCTAESYFRLKKYIDAVPLYEHHLLLCYNNEKGDSLYRIGTCYKQLGDIETAQEYFIEAMAYYRKFNDKDKLERVGHEIEKRDEQ